MDRELLLIRMLLVMGCVERNPGPTVKKFTFRYQYLLIDIGTQVIRKIFDGRAVPDLMTVLTHNQAQLQVLIKKKIITPAQEKLLPPNEPNPSSEHFDITLLCSLLRNICGLRPPGDNVWSKPAPTNKSLEAYITRLRLCRNNGSHSPSVLEDLTILENNWKELCDILTELGKFCNFQDLPTLIKKAESIDIDENSKKRFEATLELWNEMEKMFDHGLGEIKKELGAVSKGQVEITKVLKEQNKLLEGMDAKLGEVHNEIKQSNKSKDCQRVDNVSETEVFRQKLIDIYQQQFGFIQLCPLLEHEKDQTFNFYQVPEMKVVDYHKIEKPETEQSYSGHTVMKCEDIFCEGDKQCKNIYLTADAGLGKTTFSKVMAFLWCNSKIGNQIENDKLQAYADYLARFEFVFHINLRDTEELNVISMIRNQLKPYLSDDKYDNLYEIILNKYESLVLLDGLDEWVPKQIDKQKFELPIKPNSSKCVYVTLCRPYKIENVRLSRMDIDHQINIVGLNEKAIESYVAALVNYMNIIYNESKDPKNFLDEVKHVGLSFLLHIPMITSQLVLLWFDRPITSMSRSMICGNIMDLLFKIAHKREIVIPAQTSFNLRLPNALSDLNYLKDNFPSVGKLCLLSYRSLFEHDINLTSLIFTKEQLAAETYNLSEEETNLFCKIGILSKHRVYRKIEKQELKVGFLHKSYLEFLAAVYASTLETSQFLDIFNTCTTINDVLKFETFLIFYAGLSPEGIKALISRIYSVISDDLKSKRNFISYLLVGGQKLKRFIDMILTCYVEGSYHVENPILLEDCVYYSIMGNDRDPRRSMILKKLLALNGKNVKFLEARGCEYYDEFDKITNLQWLSIEMFGKNCYNVKFINLMLQNESSLHTVRFRYCGFNLAGHFRSRPTIFLSDLPINSLQHLTSFFLMEINLSHECLENTVNFLSSNILLKSIRMKYVACHEHGENSADCTISFDFSDCKNLEELQLKDTNISCSNVNVSSLKEISLCPLSKNVAACYGGISVCLQHASALSSLNCNANGLMNSDTVKHLISCIQFLPSLNNLRLNGMEIPDNIHLTLHPDVTKLDIWLSDVILSDTRFKSLINKLTKVHVLRATLWSCIITQADGDNINEMSGNASYDFMYDYLQTISTLNISTRDSWSKFEIKFKVGQ